MKTMKFKRAMLMLTLLVMTLSAVTGGTIAWFTDSVKSANNVIQSGNLDIELEYWNDSEWVDVSDKTDILTNTLWEPGVTEVAYLRVANAGSLALEYQLGINIVSETEGTNKAGEAFKLSDHIQFGVVENVNGETGAYANREAAVAAVTGAQKLSDGYTKENNVLYPANTTDVEGAVSEQYLALVVYMPTTVGNEANYKTGTAAPQIDLGLYVLATQYTYEEDSFNDQYDADAKYPPAPGTFDVYSADDFLAAANAAKAGNTINICSEITLSKLVTLPAGVVLQGNGYQINGTVNAGGDLTISGHVKVNSFSATYYNRTITIGEGSCLEITGTDRVTLGYGNVFNITGTLDNAKTADKATVQPSLIIPGGISITGGSDATMNVTNAYVQIGSTTSKNSAANGTFTLNFTNAIAEFTNQLTLSEPTNGMNPAFNINIKDSVLTTGAKFVVAVPNSHVVIDNSDVTLATYFRNSGTMDIINGSKLTGATIQFGENGGNDGITTVDGSNFTITATSAGHALDGRDTGKLVLKNGATADVTYYKDMVVETDATSKFIGTEVQ